MYYAGLPINTTHIFICALYEAGQLVRRCQVRGIPGTDMVQCDAAGVNGSSRIRSHSAPLWRMMPNGCLGSPGLVLPRA
jgi:hypothetical protein